ncbi:DUF397 domain-containing protein [Streptomyces zagrosensis]|uniref:DUF397 domain-containing protein n=1 Tax=Streptomyces zagrosensis TaxID=1042984 RepID=A0A7W9UYD8_9ACTN|nr:DUF397 domain-containing protein [Streptomyces zagrosensis]MBB5935236.1 hypothetical protein [Streptomyces zagrosensis]
MTTDSLEMVVTWRTSSYSSSNGGQCVEVGAGIPTTVPVRDSKDPHGSTLTFEPAAWNAFITSIKTGEFND